MSIEVLKQFTEDALANQFQIIMPPFPGVTDLQQTILRIKSIDIPEYSIATYEITKKGSKFTRRSGVSEMPTEFSFTYRVDKNYDVYKGIIRWMQTCRDSTTGVMLPEAAVRFPITVQPIDSADNLLSGGWVMEGCFPSSHDGISFDEESGDPLEASVTMQMLGYTVVTV